MYVPNSELQVHDCLNPPDSYGWISPCSPLGKAPFFKFLVVAFFISISNTKYRLFSSFTPFTSISAESYTRKSISFLQSFRVLISFPVITTSLKGCIGHLYTYRPLLDSFFFGSPPPSNHHFLGAQNLQAVTMKSIISLALVAGLASLVASHDECTCAVTETVTITASYRPSQTVNDHAFTQTVYDHAVTQTVYDRAITVTVTQAVSTVTVIDHVTVTDTVPYYNRVDSITVTSNAPSYTTVPDLNRVSTEAASTVIVTSNAAVYTTVLSSNRVYTEVASTITVTSKASSPYTQHAPYTNNRPSYTYSNSSSGYIPGTGTGHSIGRSASSTDGYRLSGTSIQPHSVGTGYSSTRGIASSTGRSYPSGSSVRPPYSLGTGYTSSGGYTSSTGRYRLSGTSIEPSYSAGTGYISTGGFATSTGRSYPSGPSLQPPHSVGTGYSSTRGFTSSTGRSYPSGSSVQPPHSVGTGYWSTSGFASSTGGYPLPTGAYASSTGKSGEADEYGSSNYASATDRSNPTGTSPSIPTVTVGLEDGGIVQFLPPFLPYVAAGSTVHFDFHARNHTLTESSFDHPCVKSTFPGAVDTNFHNVNLQDIAEFKPFDLLVDSDAPRYFYCKQQLGNIHAHCTRGMVFAINVDQETYSQFERNAENAAVPATPKIKGRTIAV